MSHRFDWIVDPTLNSDALTWNTPVQESELFVAIPSKGSLVPGWTLVIPRQRLINFSKLSQTQVCELNDFCRALRSTLNRFGDQIFEFEHGAQEVGSIMGCGVDQAHLHVVPLPFDLLTSARAAERTVKWIRAHPCDSPWRCISDGSEYLMVRRPETKALVGRVLQPVSQWFRKLIARELGVPNSWDYRSNTYLGNIQKTLELFTAH